jgi:hypothetical protein
VSHAFLIAKEASHATSVTDEIFIPTTGPIERLGGMERFLKYVASGFQERGYGVRVFHTENTGPEPFTSFSRIGAISERMNSLFPVGSGAMNA